jgi:hypothetical protein
LTSIISTVLMDALLGEWVFSGQQFCSVEHFF